MCDDDHLRDDPELAQGVGFGEWDIDPKVRLRDHLPTRWPRIGRSDAEIYDDDLGRDL